MRTIIIILLLLFLNSAKSQVISINDDRIIINHIQFDSASLINDYIKVLGRPSRIFHLENNIYVFDSLGIYINENYKDHNKIAEISFDLAKRNEYPFSPKRKFAGSLLLTKYHCKITSNLSYKQLIQLCQVNKNTSLRIDDRDSDFGYGIFDLFFEHDAHLKRTKNFSIDL